jgi:hypothetical protein
MDDGLLSLNKSNPQPQILGFLQHLVSMKAIEGFRSIMTG